MSNTTLGAFSIFLPILIGLVIYVIVLTIASIWHVFRKAGKPGWACVIPVYNCVVYCDISERPRWWVILLFIPLIGFIIAMIMNAALARKFGKSGTFGALGLTFLPWVFYPILASPASRHTEEIALHPSRMDRFGVLLTSLLIFCFVSYPLGVIGTIIGAAMHQEQPPAVTSMPALGPFALCLIAAANLAAFGSAVAIWKYRKWGVYSFIGLHILMFATLISNGLPVSTNVGLLLTPLILILMLRPVWNALK